MEIKQNVAIVNGINLPISRKKSVEVCNLLRNKTTKTAKIILKRVMKLEQAVPYKRYNQDTPHKVGIGPGKYPVKTSQEFLRLIESAEANAQHKGLSSNLVIDHISAHKAPLQWHYGRKRRQKQKGAHVKLIVKELKEEKNDRKADTKQKN
ncbi:50S ribosomal protein L22 [Candidatus Woesearchaeota archaeon]|nr:50S ribosomal protein L22 [Candidatus Woesearchaeota archaeon]